MTDRHFTAFLVKIGKLVFLILFVVSSVYFNARGGLVPTAHASVCMGGEEKCKPNKHMVCSNETESCKTKCPKVDLPDIPVITGAKLAPSCDCNETVVDGDLVVGNKINFRSSVKPPNSSGSKKTIPKISYSLLKDGVEIANSGSLTATGPLSATDFETGETIDVYEANWNFVPSQSGSYRLDVSVECSSGNAFNRFIRPVYAQESNQSPKLGVLSGIIAKLDQYIKMQQSLSELGLLSTPVPTDEEDGKKPSSIKLGSFETVTPGCMAVNFTVGQY